VGHWGRRYTSCDPCVVGLPRYDAVTTHDDAFPLTTLSSRRTRSPRYAAPESARHAARAAGSAVARRTLRRAGPLMMAGSRHAPPARYGPVRPGTGTNYACCARWSAGRWPVGPAGARPRPALRSAELRCAHGWMIGSLDAAAPCWSRDN
jgi:hypothetical protein